MTKFEEDLNKKMDLKEVPMYFTQSGCSMTRKTYIETNWIFDNYKNWHSDEEFQEHVLANKNLIDVNTKLAEEIADLKSQLQQQALPVVPEWLDIEIKHFKSTSKHPTVDVVFGVADAIVAVKNGNTHSKLYDYLFCGKQDVCNQHQAAFALAFITGKYQVEKPQLFYLRDELTGQFLAKDNQFKNEDRYFFWNGADPLTHSIGTAWKLSFTKQEIDSMQTGSYEQIEVTE